MIHRMNFFMFFILMLVLTACTSGNQQGELTVVPTEPTLVGNVDITYPISGSIIYSEAVYLEGTASNIPEEGFQIRLLAPDDSIIAEANIQPEGEMWSVEIVHQYTGDPTEVTIMAGSVDANNPLDYDLASVVLSNLNLRPEGTFGSILSPTNGQTIGGDTMLIIGRGSGFFENTFVLALETPDGEEITARPVTITNPYFVDDIIWEAEIERNDFLGNAVIRMYYQDAESGEDITLDTVEVVVSSVAG